MDDHDYGEPNLWGAWNGDEESGSGFFKPVCLVNALQQQSMGHNPDPATQMTLANGITVHYTSYEYGMVEFAVLEARKFKNHRGNSLLGDEQESWLRGWCSVNDEKLKIILSQTPFASLATNVTTFSSKPPFVRAVKAGSTFDTNGYPAEGRRRFMEIIQGCSPLILSGDQHLGIAVTYDDYDVMECASPAVSNDVFWRISVGKLNSTYIDGFGHSYRLLNVWNVHPDLLPKQTPYGTRFKGDVVKAKRGDGYLVVDLDGTKATCKMKGYRNGPSLIWSADAQAKFRRDDATA
jgi:alkaline phosphatase D